MPRLILQTSICLGAALTGIAAFSTCASAQQAERINIDLPAQKLGASLKSLAILSGKTVLADGGAVAHRRAPAVRGAFTLEEALQRLLAGSGFAPEPTDGGFVIAAARTVDHGDDQQIVVTGSRIRGAEVASPVLVIDHQALTDSGYTDLGEVARSLPQSFGGGQQPGIGLNVPQSVGINVGGGSSFNLRGLGSDATLTLLNGRRLPYDSALQGVDVSAIPMDAVARIEVVPDGASALYGSDAVGGVVNVILRQDYSGITTRARITAPTDGGDFGQLYGAMAGARWTGGGGYVAYEYNQNDALSSNERDTTRVRPNLSLLPSSRRHAVAAHLHQQVLENLTVEVDALYNNRASAFSYPQNAASDPNISRTDQSFRSDTLATAAAAHLSLADWEISLTGTFGKNRSAFVGDVYFNDALAQSQSGRYDNRSVTGELSADGPLFSLPGGTARVALGTGIRDNHFVLFRGTGNIANVTPSQQIRYAFGEISLPFIGPANGIAWIRKLDLSAALRFEDYRAIANIVTPKLGLIYAPSSAVDLKASWGRSFRAPSFVDQYSFSQASLYPASLFGGVGTPSNAAALFLQGGNTQLKPERARSWSATLAFHPDWLGRARVEIGYFDTRYVDRVVVPITQIAQALTNPIYAAQITRSPTPAQLAAAIGGASQFTNATGAAYDPTTVVALVDDTNTNAGIQVIRGLDVEAHYLTTLARGEASVDVDATYLTSRQQISPSQPVQTLAGTLFSPPHWRARGSATWARNGFRGVATVNYTGGIVDIRGALPIRLPGMTTVDLGARYTITRHGGVLGGIEVGLSLLNAFDAMPPVISTTLFYETPYDSTNYSAVGRVLALEVSKSW